MTKKTKLVIGSFLYGCIVACLTFALFLQPSQPVRAGDLPNKSEDSSNKSGISKSEFTNGSLQGSKTTIRAKTTRTRENERNTRKKIETSLREFGLESFKSIKKNFIKNDEVRIRYIAWVLYTENYCKNKKTCLKIGLVGNAIIRAEGGDKTIYGRYLNNPFHIKYCIGKWYEMGLVDRQAKFCKFKNYKSAIIAWWRLWEAQKFNSNSLRTARKYTGNDKPYYWLRIVNYYKTKYFYIFNK